MAEKKITWQDGSNQQVTLEAPTFSGSQKVTVKTPENLNNERSMDIIFYSKKDVSKSATLHLIQDGAEFDVTPTHLTFDAASIEAQTVKVTTNVSSGDLISVSVSDDHFSFTRSEFIDGSFTITISPKKVNDSGSQINATLFVTLGFLTRTVVLQHTADYVVSTSYKDYRLVDPKFYLITGASQDAGTGELITSDTTIPAGNFGIYLKVTSVQRTKVDHMATGEDIETTETLGEDQSVAIGHEVDVVGSYVRSKVSNPQQVSYLVNGVSLSFGDSLGTLLRNAGKAKITYDVASEVDSLPAEYTKVVIESCNAQENKVEDYVDIQDVVPSQPYDYSDSAYLFEYTADFQRTLKFSCSGTAVYTSGAKRSENVPLKFAIGTSYFEVVSQTPGSAGTGASESSVTVKTSSENTSETGTRSSSLYVGTILTEDPSHSWIASFQLVQDKKAITKKNYEIKFTIGYSPDRTTVIYYAGVYFVGAGLATSVPDTLRVTIKFTTFDGESKTTTAQFSGSTSQVPIGSTPDTERWKSYSVANVNSKLLPPYETANATYTWET